ncbi:MAG: radical SAM/Cys-rich domain protein [Gammaproteobacteria bacterium]|nr:radical SAM/Cys-rich domain protein [Gammaproteobacteria bacterium]
MHDTLPLLEPSDFPALTRASLDTLQINIGLKCNQACLHCHVNSNPYRKEKMDVDTIGLVIEFLKLHKVSTLDITGGAPEMHPQFCELVSAARKLGLHVIDRCNLTILEQPGFGNLANFLAEQQVEVVASLPCYTKDNVDQQRGDGVFESSIRGLQNLNQLGYAANQGELVLSLVYNPLGPTLAAGQQELEEVYQKELLEKFGIRFNRLLTLSNMPIKRFGSTLVSRGQFDDYMSLLKKAHSDDNLDSVMCRSLISVDWQGYLYDCDFNQMLDLPVLADNGKNMHLSELLKKDITGNNIVVRDHCYACTAGQGSSCSGALI